MSALTQLDLKTADGRRLMHKFYRRKNPAGLLVTFPGAHYMIDAPLLYYSALALGRLGWDTMALSYGFQTAGEPFSPAAIADLLSECRAALEHVLSLRPYARLGLLGKSLGALVAAFLCGEMAELAAARTVYLTPPLGETPFAETLEGTRQPALVVIGSEDRYFDQDALDALSAQAGVTLRIVAGADHSMNIPGDLRASLAAVGEVAEQAVAFLTT